MIRSFEELLEAAKKGSPVPMAVAMANDENVIESVAESTELGLIKPILVGPEKEIKDLLSKLELDFPYELVDAEDKFEASQIATKLVSSGKAEFLMKGLVDTSVLLKEVLNKEYGLRTGNVLSHVGVVAPKEYGKLIFISDGAMLIEPNAEQKQKVIENTVPIMQALGIEKPKVAIVGAVEKVNEKMQATLDAQTIVENHKNGAIPEAIIEGPYALDNAVDKESARIKGIEGEVAGDADMILAPRIECGNILYKALVYLGGAKSAGLLTGATHPVVLTSRADSAEAKLYSIALATVVAMNR